MAYVALASSFKTMEETADPAVQNTPSATVAATTENTNDDMPLTSSGRSQRRRQKPKRMNDDFYTDFSGKSWNRAQKVETKEAEQPQNLVQNNAASSSSTSSSRAASRAPSLEEPALLDEEDDSEGVEEFDSEEEYDGTLYCTCRMPYRQQTRKLFMIQCDTCTQWYHGNCVNLSKEERKRAKSDEGDYRYDCPDCRRLKEEGVPDEEIFRIINDKFAAWQAKEAAELEQANAENAGATSVQGQKRLAAPLRERQRVVKKIKKRSTPAAATSRRQSQSNSSGRGRSQSSSNTSRHDRPSSSQADREDRMVSATDGDDEEEDEQVQEEEIPLDDDDEDFEIERELKIVEKPPSRRQSTPKAAKSGKSPAKTPSSTSSSRASKEKKEENRLRKLIDKIKNRQKIGTGSPLKTAEDGSGENAEEGEDDEMTDQASKAAKVLNFSGSTSPSEQSKSDAPTEAKRPKITTSSDDQGLGEEVSNTSSSGSGGSKSAAKSPSEAVKVNSSISHKPRARSISSSSATGERESTHKESGSKSKQSSSSTSTKALGKQSSHSSSSKAGEKKTDFLKKQRSTSSSSKERKDSTSKEAVATPASTSKSASAESKSTEKKSEGKSTLERSTSSVSTSSSSTHTNPKEMRKNFRKVLRDIFETHYAALSEEDKSRIPGVEGGDGTESAHRYIKKLAAKIDEELWSYQSGHLKLYISKSRTLRFNLKNPANTLAFEVMTTEVSVSRLVEMKHDDLASNELKAWRENEKRTQLEALQRDAEEKVKQGALVVKKTHKGEEELVVGKGGGIKNSDLPTELLPSVNVTTGLETVTVAHKPPLKNGPTLSKKAPETTAITNSSSKASGSSSSSSGHHHSRHHHHQSHSHGSSSSKPVASTSHASTSSKTASSSTVAKGPPTPTKKKAIELKKEAADAVTSSSDPLGLFDLMRDTTAEHGTGAHVYSNTCLICTGKQAPPEERKKRPSETKYNGLASSTSKRSRRENGDDKDSASDEVAHAGEEAGDDVQDHAHKRHRGSTNREEDVVSDQNGEHSVELTDVNAAALAMDIRPLAPAVAMAPAVPISGGADAIANAARHSRRPFWDGTIFMSKVANFEVTAKLLRCNQPEGLKDILVGGCRLPVEGRITYEQATSYVERIRAGPENRQNYNDRVTVLQFFYKTNLDRTGFDAFFQYFASRRRYAMVLLNNDIYKDFYLLPLHYDQPTPKILKPLTRRVARDRKRGNILLGFLIPHSPVDPDSLHRPAIVRPIGRGDNGESPDIAHTPPPRSFTPPLLDVVVSAAADAVDTEDAGSYTPPHPAVSSTPPLPAPAVVPPYNPEQPMQQLRMIGSDGSSYTVQPSVLLPQVLGAAASTSGSVTTQSAFSNPLSAFIGQPPNEGLGAAAAPPQPADDLMDKLKNIHIPSNLDLGQILKNVREKTGQIEPQPPQHVQVDAGVFAEGESSTSSTAVVAPANRAAVNDPRLMRSAAASVEGPSPVNPEPAMAGSQSAAAAAPTPPINTTSTSILTSVAPPALPSFPLAAMPPDELRRLAQEHMARLTSGADEGVGSEQQPQPMDIDQRVPATAAAVSQQFQQPQQSYPQQQHIQPGFLQYPPPQQSLSQQQYQQHPQMQPPISQHQQQQFYGHNVPATPVSANTQSFMSPQGPPPPPSSIYQGQQGYQGQGYPQGTHSGQMPMMNQMQQHQPPPLPPPPPHHHHHQQQQPEGSNRSGSSSTTPNKSKVSFGWNRKR